jgi:hypothetical protein
MNDWNCADESYKMTANGDGTFSYTFNVTPGDYQLKVTNGTWDISFGDPNGPEGNFAFNASDEGKATVKFDGSNVSVEFGEPEANTGDTIGAEDEGKVDEPKDEDTKNEKKGNGGLIGGIIATVAILAAGAAAVFFVLKKK